jgi:hypothetical protein
MHKYKHIPHPVSVEKRIAPKLDPRDATSRTDIPEPRRAALSNISENSLAWLFAHQRISSAQMQAGDCLHKDYVCAGLMSCVTMRWDPAASPTGGRRGAAVATDATPARIDAKRRFDAALAAVGPGLSDICWRVICAGEAIGIAERALNWPSRSGRLVLTLALDRLVQFYRISA